MAHAKTQISQRFYNNSKTPTSVTAQYVETEVVNGQVVPVKSEVEQGVKQ